MAPEGPERGKGSPIAAAAPAAGGAASQHVHFVLLQVPVLVVGALTTPGSPSTVALPQHMVCC
jgi:hypothetical protein